MRFVSGVPLRKAAWGSERFETPATDESPLVLALASEERGENPETPSATDESPLVLTPNAEGREENSGTPHDVDERVQVSDLGGAPNVNNLFRILSIYAGTVGRAETESPIPISSRIRWIFPVMGPRRSL